MKSTRSEGISQKKLTKHTSLTPQTSKAKSHNEVKEKKEETKDSLSRTNTKDTLSRTNTKDTLSRTNTKDSLSRTNTKDSLSRTNTKDTLSRTNTKDTLSRTSSIRKSTKGNKTAAIPSKVSAVKTLEKPATKTDRSNEKLDSKISKNGTTHPQTVAKKLSNTSVNKKVTTPRKVTEPTAVKGVAKNTSNSVKKELPLITNVTVNSPVHEKKANKKIENNEVDDNSRVRTKTRTLKDGEAKILTIDNNVEINKLIDKVNNVQKALPKSFYIDLSDKHERKTDNKKQTQVENKIQISESSNEINNGISAHIDKPVEEDIAEDGDSYEDDFESYESDFESYKSEPSSKTYSDSSESLEKSVNDEKMLDSGSFELRDGSYKAVTAGVGVMEEIEEGVGTAGVYEESEEENEKKEQQQQSSLTDEGFIEMVSSASPVKKVPARRSSNFFDLLKSRETSRKKREAEARQRRAADLTNMITLDQVTFSLYEMRPLSYDAFMSLYGQGASHMQAYTQTNVDSETRATQTEDIFYNTMWTQCPLEFSKEDVWIADRNKSNKTIDRNKHMEDTIESIMGIDIEKEFETKEEDGSKWMKMDSNKEMYSKYFNFATKSSDMSNSNWNNVDPLIVYIEQKNGCGTSERIRKKEYENMLMRSCDYDVEKLSKFLNKVSKRVIMVLGRSKMAEDDGWKVNEDKEWQFSKGYKVAIKEDEGNDPLKIQSLVVSETDDRVIVSVYESVDKEMDCRSKMCIWKVDEDGRWERINFLSCSDRVRNCGAVGSGEFGNGLAVVAGLEDGSVCVWDVDTRNKATELAMTSSIQGPEEWSGRIVGLITNTLPSDGGTSYVQWHVLYEYGTLCTYRMTRRKSQLYLTASQRLHTPPSSRYGSRRQEENITCNWESGLICYALRRALHKNALLVACNGGRVTEIAASGVLRVYNIQETWCTFFDIAPYHSHSAGGNHSTGWYTACGGTERSLSMILARGSRAMRTLATRSEPGINGNDEMSIWWSRSGATILLLNGGVVSVCELTRGDLEGASSALESHTPIKSITSIGTALGVVYESGCVELHRLVQNADESRLLYNYLQLL